MSEMVSVLMSVLNGEKTMDRAIDSILGQTYREIELILCDDGSTDATWAKMQRYREADKRIVLLRNAHTLGLAASLNRCLQVASGVYIARQDADDFSHPERIERTLAFLQSKRLPYAACGVLISDADGIWSKRIYPQQITRHDIVKSNPFFHPTMIFRQEVIRSVGGYRVSNETRRTEDYDLVMRLAARQMIGQNMQEFLYEVSEPRGEYGRKHKRITRWYEFRTRWYGYRAMHVAPVEYAYLLKPLVLCFIPLYLLTIFKHVQWKMKLKGNHHD